MVFRGTSRWWGWGCPGKPFTREKFARESLIILWMASHGGGSDLFPREKKNITIISLQYRTGRSTQESLMTQRAGMGWEAGIYVYLGLIHIVVQQILTQHCKATTLQFHFFKNKTISKT